MVKLEKNSRFLHRYVGKVCGQNKAYIAIPCHRVIRNDGFIGGYSANGGINLKRRLINFEKNELLKKKNLIFFYIWSFTNILSLIKRSNFNFDILKNPLKKDAHINYVLEKSVIES